MVLTQMHNPIELMQQSRTYLRWRTIMRSLRTLGYQETAQAIDELLRTQDATDYETQCLVALDIALMEDQDERGIKEVRFPRRFNHKAL
jgi:hypothetical protein